MFFATLFVIVDDLTANRWSDSVDDQKWFLLESARQQKTIIEAFHQFRLEGIEPILIKGWAISRLYPSKVFRSSTDIDLAVPSTDLLRAKSLLSEGRMPSGVVVDLHNELKKFDTLPWKEVFANSRLVDLGGQKIRILREEDHLRVLCVHWLNDGGVNKDRLWDVYYAISTRGSDFDWNKCLDVLDSTRRGWIITTIALANKYLQLDISELPFDASAEIIPSWMTKFLEKEWRQGIRLQSLHLNLNNPKVVWQQVRKRFPPNPIQSTIEANAAFDNSGRLPYQLKGFVNRLRPSAKRIFQSLFRKRL